jgi:DNA polymerase-3 subunit gamma/tau
MANYRALTRTYRPSSFDDVVSQEHVSNTLKNAIAQNRLAHAYMFCGPRGVGKTTMARVLARAINHIDQNVDGEALSQTMNVVEIDAASNNKVDDVHHLREIVRVPPQTGSYKVFIIDEVHMLSKQAFNALLKTLEEPPPHAIFIFATTEPHKVLPTILSRVQRFDFKRISVDEIVTRLRSISEKESIQIDDESLHTIAKKADGALRDALGLMDQAIAFCGTDIRYDELVKALNVIGNDDLFEFTEAVAAQDPQAGLLFIDRILKDGADIQEFLVSLTNHLRNLYVARQKEGMHLIEATEETKDRYIAQAKTFNDSDLMRMMHLVSEAQIKMKDVQQPRVHFEILALKLVHMTRNAELKKLLQSIDGLKKNGSSLVEDKNHSKKEDLSTPLTDPVASGPKATGKDETSNSQYSNNDVARSAEVNEQADKNSKAEYQRTENREESESPVKEMPQAGVPSNSSGEVQGDDAEEDHYELLMGKPSLQSSSKQAGNRSGTASAIETEEQVPSNGTKTLQQLSDVEECWKDVLDMVQNKASKTLYLQLADVQLKELKGTELVLSVNNPFAVNILESNKKKIGRFCKEITGVHLRIKCVVDRNGQDKDAYLSPFERFRELQKKDKNLKTIVDLFGAEIEHI